MCRGKKKANDDEPARNEQPKLRREPTHLPKEDCEANEKSGDYSMYNITTGSASEVWTVDIELCGKPHHIEIDSGATKTVISEVTYDAIRDTVDLTKSNSVLSTYTGEKIPVLGKVTLHVGYGGQDYKLLALVLKGAGPNLLGRDWLQVIKVKWKTRFKVKEDHLELSQVLELYNQVFKDKLGTLKGKKVKIHVDANAKPKFCKARSVLYALKDKIEHELVRLINEGILSPIEFGEWATTIVPVLKPNGKVRICGNYKCTVNKA